MPTREDDPKRKPQIGANAHLMCPVLLLKLSATILLEIISSRGNSAIKALTDPPPPSSSMTKAQDGSTDTPLRHGPHKIRMRPRNSSQGPSSTWSNVTLTLQKPPKQPRTWGGRLPRRCGETRDVRTRRVKGEARSLRHPSCARASRFRILVVALMR